MDHFRFAAADATVETYEQLMTEVDGFYSGRAIVHFKGVPLTMKKEGFMTISLDLGDDSLDMAISGKDGYFSAFREGGVNQDPELPWYHFKDASTEGLGGGRKRKLAKLSSYRSLIKDEWSGIRVGGEVLRHCCRVLLRFLRAHRLDPAAADNDEVDLSDEECRALARLIVMVCEPSKLRSARNFMISSLVNVRDIQITEKVKTKIKNWGKLSRYGLHCLERIIKDSDDFDPKELSLISHCQIRSLDETVGPNGELLLILCRDYEKESLDSRRQHG